MFDYFFLHRVISQENFPAFNANKALRKTRVISLILLSVFPTLKDKILNYASTFIAVSYLVCFQNCVSDGKFVRCKFMQSFANLFLRLRLITRNHRYLFASLWRSCILWILPAYLDLVLWYINGKFISQWIFNAYIK